MTKKEERPSAGGSRVFRYSGGPQEGPLVEGDAANIEAISAHVEQHVGKIDFVFHEFLSPTVHVDLHHVPPAEGRPFHTLVTSGMSDRPMAVPDGFEQFAYGELVALLPYEWPLTQADFTDERNYWPLRQLKILARFPHQYRTWLGFDHTIPNGDPPEPYAEGTAFCGLLLSMSVSLPPDFSALEMPDGRRIHFLTLTPLYAEEMELKLKKGVEALYRRFEKAGVSDVIEVGRPNACAKRRWLSFL